MILFEEDVGENDLYKFYIISLLLAEKDCGESSLTAMMGNILGTAEKQDGGNLSSEVSS